MSVIETLVIDRTAADAVWLRQMEEKGLAGRSDSENAQFMRGYATEDVTFSGGCILELSGAGVVYLREGFLRGAYNDLDMNRVGAAVVYLAERLHNAGINVDVDAKTDWSRMDVPTAGQLERYRQNVAALRIALPVLAGTPEVPENMDGLTYGEANDIETILVALDATLTRLEGTYLYSGEPYSGEV